MTVIVLYIPVQLFLHTQTVFLFVWAVYPRLLAADIVLLEVTRKLPEYVVSCIHLVCPGFLSLYCQLNHTWIELGSYIVVFYVVVGLAIVNFYYFLFHVNCTVCTATACPNKLILFLSSDACHVYSMSGLFICLRTNCFIPRLSVAALPIMDLIFVSFPSEKIGSDYPVCSATCLFNKDTTT